MKELQDSLSESEEDRDGSESNFDHASSPPEQVSEDLPISPSEDLKCYGDLIKRMAAMLRFQISQPQPKVMDSVYDIVQRETSTSIALPIPGVLLQDAKDPWTTGRG